MGLVFPAGNTGEAASLSPREWTRVVEVSAATVAGRAAVVPGIGHELPQALDMAARAESLGADGLLLMPREQPYVCSAGIVAYWRRILAATTLPVIVYKRTLPHDGELRAIVTEPQVLGCKYADHDVSRFADITAALPDAVVWTCGIAERYAPAFHQAGASGFTSGLANFAPRISHALQDALVAGDASGAARLRDRCAPFENLRARHDGAFNVAAVKTAMDAVGLAGGSVRPPLRDLDEPARREVHALVPDLLS